MAAPPSCARWNPIAVTEDSLHGITVVVTRPEHQAGELCRAIESAGGQAVRFPTLAVAPVGHREAALATHQLARMAQGDMAIFVSANAVEFGMPLMPDGCLPDGVHALAVGRATARALESHGVANVLTPIHGYNSEALLNLEALQRVQGKYLAILHAPEGRRIMQQELQRRGGRVENVVVYYRSRPRVSPEALGNALAARSAIVTIITSAQSLHNLVAMVESVTLRRLQQAALVVISERVKVLAARLGFSHITVAAGPDTRAILAAVEAAAQSR